MQALNRIPLSCLRAVEAVARLGTVAAAAADLGVTPGAISQHVQRAEQILGLALFDRTGRGMQPTPRGLEVTRELAQGFAHLALAVERARPDPDRTLTVSVAPVFAARWLIWRLPRFQAAHPGLRVRLDASVTLADPSRGEADLCIRVGRGGWPGVEAERLFDQIIFPVASPGLAATIATPEDLARVPVIIEPNAGFSWQDWLRPEGWPTCAWARGPSFPTVRCAWMPPFPAAGCSWPSKPWPPTRWSGAASAHCFPGGTGPATAIGWSALATGGARPPSAPLPTG